MESEIRLSFEFFPPKTEKGAEKLIGVRDALAKYQPEFFSVTYGAGGSTRDNTKNIVCQFNDAGIATAPHLSFGGDDEASIADLIGEYRSHGVNRIVALRGDRPSGSGSGTRMVYANELVAFIRKQFGDDMHLEVAAYPEIHPEAKSYSEDIRYLKGKFEAGANSAITQYFFNPDAYFYFVEQCQAAGIDQPIYPGIMPISNYANLARFSDACGAEIPRWMRKRLDSFGDDTDSIKAFGAEIVSDLCEVLLENGAPGIHFYTMNQLEPTQTLLQNLGISAND